MDTHSEHSEHIDTVVIGAGQAGLSVGYHLRQRNRSFVVLDGHEQVGDNWRRQWDSLRLFTPARVDNLPGRPFPADDWHFPTKDEMADYLEDYARELALPVRTGVRVESLERDGDGYLLRTSEGTLSAENVVVATGTFGRTPSVPDFASELDDGIRQLHSSEYRRPAQLKDGPVLVVGASHSGAEIAYEVGGTHETVLSGRIDGELPIDIEGRPAHAVIPALFFLARHVLTLKTPMGRKMRPEVRAHGGPLLRIKRADLARVGVEWTADRTTGVQDGQPVLGADRLVEVANVIWCTGFRQEFGWIRIPVLDETGWPEEQRGVVASSPGLYFCGLSFQSAFASMLVGGAGADAAYVARHIDGRMRSSARHVDELAPA